MIIINIDKAKEIKKTQLRIDRTPLLQVQDIEFQRALESGTDTSNIIAEKQRLRDITKLVDTVNTIEELKEITLF